jgi:hypothetical protein
MMAKFPVIAGLLLIAMPQAIASPKEGCAVTLQDQCNAAGGDQARAQCIQNHPDGLSDPCRAANAQNPPPGIAKHLGTEPVVTKVVQSGPSPFALKLFDSLPTPAPPPQTAPLAAPIALAPLPKYVAPKVIFAPKPAAATSAQP